MGRQSWCAHLGLPCSYCLESTCPSVCERTLTAIPRLCNLDSLGAKDDGPAQRLTREFTAFKWITVLTAGGSNPGIWDPKMNCGSMNYFFLSFIQLFLKNSFYFIKTAEGKTKIPLIFNCIRDVNWGLLINRHLHFYLQRVQHRNQLPHTQLVEPQEAVQSWDRCGYNYPQH